MIDKLLSTEQVCAILKMERHRLYRLANERKIESTRFSRRGPYMFTRDAVEDYIRRHTTEVRPETSDMS